jgi:hypothetical protein
MTEIEKTRIPGKKIPTGGQDDGNAGKHHEVLNIAISNDPRQSKEDQGSKGDQWPFDRFTIHHGLCLSLHAKYRFVPIAKIL